MTIDRELEASHVRELLTDRIVNASQAIIFGNLDALYEYGFIGAEINVVFIPHPSKRFKWESQADQPNTNPSSANS